MGKTVNMLLLSLLLVGGTTAAYFQTTGFDFISSFDDTLYIVENSRIHEGLTMEGVQWAFSTTHAANWHPFTWISHMIDVHLYGMNPGGHHKTNIWLHLANTLLLFALLARMCRTVWTSALVAALFALHPLHVESVAWISERKDLLCAFFGFLSLHAYVSHVKKRNIFFYLSSCLLYLFSLLSKPMLVSLPLLLLLMDFWPLQRFSFFRTHKDNEATESNHTLFIEKVPYVLLAAASCVITMIAQAGAGAISSLENISPGLRVCNALLSYVRYLSKTVYPCNLSVFYPYPESIEAVEVVLSGLLLFGVTLFFLFQWKKRPYLLTGWLWFLISLFPVIGIVQVGEQAMADRYMYIPIIGLFFIFAWFAKELVEQRGVFKISIIALGALVVALSGWTSFEQIAYWKNSTTLFSHAIEVTENNITAHHNLAVAYSKKGDSESAMQQYRVILTLDKTDPLANSNLGLLYVQQGDLEHGISYYRKALQTQPNLIEARFNLGLALTTQGKFKEAVEEFDNVIARNSSYARAYYRAGVALAKGKQMDKAISYYRKTIQTDPAFVKAYVNLGIILEENKGKIEEAITKYRDAIRIAPDFYEAYNTLGVTFAKQGKWEEAITNFSRAVTINPDYRDAKENLDRAKRSKEN